MDPTLHPLDGAAAQIVEKAVSFESLDGYPLGGVLFSAVDIAVPRVAAIFACGGGSPSWYYKRLCRYLASCGLPVLLFDYRGIGLSRPRHLRGFAAGFEAWGTKDAAAAIAWLQVNYPAARLVGIAHSIGPMILGIAPNVSALRRFAFLGPHTGYWRDYLPVYRIPMLVFWHYLVPISALILGYFPGAAIGLGSDFPKQFAIQWHARVHSDYSRLLPEPEHLRVFLERLAAVRGSALVIAAKDDAFGNERGMGRMLEAFEQLHADVWIPVPNDFNVNRIGHFGYFRQGRERDLWPALFAYLVEQDYSEKHLADSGSAPGGPVRLRRKSAREDIVEDISIWSSAVAKACIEGTLIEPVLAELARKFEFDHVTYMVAASPAEGHAPRTYILTTLLDEEWVSQYARSAFVEVDPRVIKTHALGAPLIWDIGSELGNNPRTDSFLRRAQLVGICSGIVIPLASSMAPRAMMGFHSSRQHVAVEERERLKVLLPQMTDLANAFHVAFVQQYVKEGRPSILVGRALTLQEQACLALAARGRERVDIASRLSIPEVAVHFHLDAVLAKLDATDLGDAIAKARSIGLVD